MASTVHAQPEVRDNYLSFALGAIPVTIGGDPAARTAFSYAVQAIDGSLNVYSYTTLVAPTTVVELVFELPAPTTFDRFAIPNIRETPSPGQTFVRDVAVHGSQTSATDGYTLLASAALATHTGADQVTDLPVVARPAVRWVKLVLQNGIDVQRDRVFLEFSDLVGNGTQETVGLATGFGGGWRGRGVAMLLAQDGPVVRGCYDKSGDLDGTVSGNVLRATGVDRSDGVKSLFIATVGDDGTLRGLRSTNGAPFALFTAETVANNAQLGCPDPAPPALGCGSVVHGIQFDFDSAAIRPESTAVLDALRSGLAGVASGSIRIEGHTSSEGADAYNQGLSERRASSVREALVARGLPAGRLSASGAGESRPIATNDDESGRSLNRRVEIHCTA